MAGLDSFLKYIHDLDTGYKLAGFIVVAILAGVTTLARNKGVITKAGFIVLISILGFVACVAIIASSVSVKRTYLLTVTLRNAAKVPYNISQADVNVNNKMAVKDYSAQYNTWQFELTPDVLPKDRSITLFASTNDKKFIASQQITVTDDPNQSVSLTLEKDTIDFIPSTPLPPHPAGVRHTYSINPADASIRRDIEDHSDYRFDPGAIHNRIIVTYDTASIVLNADFYVFNASCPVVYIDGILHKLEGCSIPSTISKNKVYLQKYGTDQVTAIAIPFLKQNPTLLAKWLTGK